MALQEELTGAFQGLSQGLLQANLANTRSEANDIRRQRSDALNRASQATIDRLPTVPQAQKGHELTMEKLKAERDIQVDERNQAIQAAAERTEIEPIRDRIAKDPAFQSAFQNQIDWLVGKASPSLDENEGISTTDYKEFVGDFLGDKGIRARGEYARLGIGHAKEPIEALTNDLAKLKEGDLTSKALEKIEQTQTGLDELIKVRDANLSVDRESVELTKEVETELAAQRNRDIREAIETIQAARAREAAQKESVSQQKFNILEGDEFKKDLTKAQDLLRMIRRGDNITITEDEVVDRMENKYPAISGDLRGMLEGEESFEALMRRIIPR